LVIVLVVAHVITVVVIVVVVIVVIVVVLRVDGVTIVRAESPGGFLLVRDLLL
jgi:hypothetical protein